MRYLRLVILYSTILLLFGNCTDSSTSENEANNNIENTLLKHTFYKKAVLDEPWGTHIDQTFILESKTVTEKELNHLLTSLHNKAKNTTGYMYNDNPTSVRIWVYLSLDKAESGNGQWIGMISKDDAESKPDDSPQITISEQQLRLTTIISQNKFGFTEEERQKIYKRLTKIELENIENESLKPKYEKELAKELNTTVAILDSIGTEGFSKGWTMQGLSN